MVESSNKKGALVTHIGVGLFLVIAIFTAKWPTLKLPYHWDEMSVYVMPSHDLAGGELIRAWPGYRSDEQFFGRPPLLYLVMAVVYRLFGESIFVTHAFTLLAAWLSLYYTYLLARHLFENQVGVMACLLLFASPLFFAQAGLFTADIWITAFGVMTVYYAVRQKWIGYVLAGIVLVLLKETAIAMIVGIWIYQAITPGNKSGSVRTLLICSVPAFVFAGFYCWQRVVAGHWMCNPAFYDRAWYLGFTVKSMAAKALATVVVIATKQNRIILSTVILLSLLIYKREAWKKEYRLFLILGIMYVLSFSVISFTERYVLLMVPYVCVVGAGAVAMLIKGKKLQWVFVLFVLAAFGLQLHSSRTGYGSFDYDMQYTDVVSIHRQLAAYCEKHLAGRRIVSEWPMTDFLRYRYLGYVQHPLDVVSVGNAHDKADVFIGLLGTGKNANDKERIISENNMILQTLFTQNHKTIYLYLRRELAGKGNNSLKASSGLSGP